MSVPSKSTTMVPPQSSGKGFSLYIIVGVCCGVLVLIAATILVISVTVCLYRKRKNLPMTTTDNIAYDVNENEMEMSGNVSYSATTMGDNTSVKDYEDANEDMLVYDYVSTSAGNDIIVPVSNVAYNTPNDVPLSRNQAYGITQS